MSSLKDRLRAANAKKRKQLEGNNTSHKLTKKAKKVNKSKAEPKKEFKAGKAIKATDQINCLGCMRWKKCPSKKKSYGYACSKIKLYPLKKESAPFSTKKVNINLGASDKDKGLSKEERVISELISRTLKGAGVIAADARVDDRDMPTSPNFFTWMTDPNYAGNIVTPWAKQIEHPTKLLGEWCPNKKCTDLDYWENVPVDATMGDIQERVTFLEWGICPKCGTRKSEHISRGKLKPYNALVGLAGQRLAKTFTACSLACYDEHRLLKSQNPQAMFGIPSSQVLTGTFAALTFEQAKNMVWSNMYNMMSDGTWFQRYTAMMKEQCYRLGIEDVVQISNTYARFRHRNLFYLCSGPSKRTMRGATRITAMVDEIGWFTVKLKAGKAGEDPERLDAKGVHDALDRSLGTVRNGAYNLLMSGGNENVSMGYLYEVSSPQSKTDMIMKRYEQSRGSITIYGYRMATWEGNPTMGRNSPLIEEAFREDPIAAMRDWGAVPPVSGSPFIKLSSLRNLFSTKRENGGIIKTVRISNSAGQPQTTGRIKKLRAHMGEPSVLALDAGSVNNSFALSVLYASNKTGRVICPLIGEVFPSLEAPIHFPDLVGRLMTQLIEHYNVGMVVADRWQSLMLLQTLAEEHNLGWAQRSLQYADFDNFRQSAIYDGNLLLPKLENKPREAIRMAGNTGYPGMFINQPMSHLVYQLVAVNDVPAVTVTKPDGGTDDLFRSLVLGYTAILDPEYAEFFEGGPSQQAHIGVMVNGIGVSGGASFSSNIGVAVSPRGGGTASKGGMGVVAGRG
jgi:hypothetical protein